MPKAPTIVIGFSGSATLREADDVAERLKEALATGDRVEIDCGGLEDVDLSFVQIVLAARKSALASGKEVALNAPARGRLATVLDHAGIGSVEMRAFWFDERAV